MNPIKANISLHLQLLQSKIKISILLTDYHVLLSTLVMRIWWYVTININLLSYMQYKSWWFSFSPATCLADNVLVLNAMPGRKLDFDHFGGNMYLSPVFSTSTPTIHWSYTIRCHISVTVSADIDTVLTGLLAPCIAATTGRRKQNWFKLKCYTKTIIIFKMHQSQLLKTSQLKQSILLYISSMQSKCRDSHHMWLHRKTNVNSQLLLL